MNWKNWVVENIFLSTQYRLDNDNQRSKGGFIKSAQQAQRDGVSLGLLERHESEETRWTLDKIYWKIQTQQERWLFDKKYIQMGLDLNNYLSDWLAQNRMG